MPKSDKTRQKNKKPTGLRDNFIRTMAMAGHTNSEIGAEVGLDRREVSRILNNEETLELVNLGKARLYRLMEKSIDTLEWTMDYKEKDGIAGAAVRSAMAVLKSVGVLRDKIDIEYSGKVELAPSQTFGAFCERAGYPRPYEKQVEMKDFVVRGGSKGLQVPRLLLGARTYGKTIFSTICGVAYEIYCDRTFTVLLTTKVEKNGRRILKEISRCLKANGVELETDNADEIRVRGLVGKEASAMLVPLGSSGFRSLHPRLAILDDPVVPGSVSEADREQVKIVYSEIMKLTKNVAIIGQPVDFRDLYQYLRDIIETMEVPYGEIPELDEDLGVQRAAGVDEKSIQASYFLKVDPEGDATFSGIERIEKFPRQESIGFIDPADGGDYTAFGVFTGHFQGMAIVGSAWKKRWDLCIPDIKEMCQKFHVKKLAFEVNKFGLFPLQALRENLHDIGVSVEGKYTHSNKESRIQLAAQYSKSLYLSKESNPEYIRQVLEYSYDAKFDDSPDTIATFLEWAGRIRPPRAVKRPSGDL